MINYNIPDWLVLSLSRVLLGEIYPNIRAIALKYTIEKKHLVIRYYLDREPTDFDYESIDIVAMELSSGSAGVYFDKCDVECIYSAEPKGKLEPLDGFIYARREYDLEDNI